MRIEIAAGMLKAALKTLQPIVSRRVRIPILSGVKFAGGRLTVTDIDRELSVSVAALEFSGEGCLSFWPLFHLAGSLAQSLADGLANDDTLTIRMDGGDKFAVVVSRFGRYRIPAFEVCDFPHLTIPEDGQTIAVDGEALKRAIAFAAPFASREETRYYLNGVCLLGRDVVGTDGHRMGVVRDVSKHRFQNLIIPNDAVKILLSMPPVDRITLGHVRFAVEAAGLRFVAKLVDGPFPDVERVIPKVEREARVSRAALLGSVRRLSTFSEGRSPFISMVLEGDRLALAASGLDGEGGEELIEASGEPFAAEFNGRYLRELIGAVAGEDLIIGQEGDPSASRGPYHPTIWRGDSDKRFVVLMPTRSNGGLDVARAALSQLDERKEMLLASRVSPNRVGGPNERHPLEA